MKNRGQTFPTWLEELLETPLSIAESYPVYYTRGYKFRVFEENSTRLTVHSGVSSKSDTTVYYGILREILEVHFPGVLDLRFIAFNCDWYSPTEGYGVRHDEFGVTWVHSGRNLENYDPFVLASQADQVCYICPPQVSTDFPDPWITVTHIHPRGTVLGVPEHDPLQEDTAGGVGLMDNSLNVDLVIDFTGYAEEPDPNPETVLDEFEDPNDSAESDYSTDSDYEIP